MVIKETAKVASREEIKNEKKSKKEEQTHTKKLIRVRLIPIWLRLVLILVAMVISTIIGLVVGYGVIGNGEPADALNKSTWQHIVDLIEKQ